MGLQKQSTKSWAQGKCVYRRNTDGNNQGDPELLIENPRRTGNKSNRNKYSTHHQGNGNNSPGNLIHGSISSRQGTLSSFFHFGVHCFHHHNGIIHHNTNRQHESKQGQQIDGISKQTQEEESTDNRHRNSNSWDQSGSKILKEDKYHNKYQYKCFY